jgi:glutamate/tyrosine decarboxylase-like PLP-dependent enzyme
VKSSALIEIETINLLLQLLDLPKSFMGGFVTGATMSNSTCLRHGQWIGKPIVKISQNGISVSYTYSVLATSHASSISSLQC